MKITRREFCAEIAATAALASPVAAAAIPTEGLKPMIKYRGGKSKEFAQYARFIPRDFSTYFEPFVGGGATFFRLAPQKEVLCCDYEVSFKRASAEEEWRAVA